MHDARVSELGLQLPGPFPPHDPLDAVIVHNGTARTSGCLPRTVEGALFAHGQLGAEVAVLAGVQCAELCALNALSLLRAALGSLDVVERVLTVTAFISCTADFIEQPTVADGASRMLEQIFGPAGRHSRSAIGVAALPRGAPVEIEVTVALAGGAF